MADTEKVKAIIDKKHKDSNGSCGTYIPDMAFKTELTNGKLYPILRSLYDDKYITVKDGINGKMIFKNK
jgi:hypothetical protein